MRKLLFVAAAVCALVVVVSVSVSAETRASEMYKVIADSLNVRSDPAIEAPVVGSLKAGDLVSVMKEEHGWLKVRKDRISGWVAGYYLNKSSDREHSAAGMGENKTPDVRSASAGKGRTAVRVAGLEQASVLGDDVRIRSGPGTKYRVVGSVSKGVKITLLGARSGWLQIRLISGMEGWVAEAYIQAGNGIIQPTGSKLKGKVIVIDPGHGGNDPGMIGTTYETLEKELNLSTARFLEGELQARGATVVLTRTDNDDKPELNDRVQVSETIGADAFVSIHYNSSEKKTSGTLTFYYSEMKDLRLARAIENRLSEGTGLKSNGVAFGNYHVLRENDTPSALVELGFLSNPKDENIVREASYQQMASVAIAEGLEQFFK